MGIEGWDGYRMKGENFVEKVRSDISMPKDTSQER